MPNVPLFLPTESSGGQMYGAWAALLARFGYQFGEILDHQMRRQVSEQWLDGIRIMRLRQDPGFRATLHDPSFLLKETARRDSPCRRVMPAGDAWAPYCDAVRHRRNDWAHHKVDWSLDELEASTEDLQRLLQELGLHALPLGRDVSAMLARIFEIRSNGGVFPDPQVEELRALLVESERQYEHTQARVVELTDQLQSYAGKAEASDEERRSLNEQLRVAEQRAAEERQSYERQLRELNERTESRRASSLMPPPSLVPGDPWPLPRGTRRMFLQKAPAVGLIDLDAGGLVGGDLEEAAKSAAARWLKFKPEGGEIWVTDTWHAAGMLGLNLIYLGRIDEDPVQDETIGAAIASVLTPRGYVLTAGGQIAAASGASLADSIGAAEAARVAEQLAAGAAAARASAGLEPDAPVDLRITYDGVVAAPFGEEDRGFIGRVHADQWFPGVVRA